MDPRAAFENSALSGQPVQADAMSSFVENLLKQMQDRFANLSSSIASRIDEMGSRIDDLEKQINDLAQAANTHKDEQP